MARISSVLSFDTSVPILFLFFCRFCLARCVGHWQLHGMFLLVRLRVLYVDSSCRVGARAADDSVARALHRTCVRVCAVKLELLFTCIGVRARCSGWRV